jgi:hypothetical protein
VSHAPPSHYLHDQSLLKPKHPTSHTDPITPAGPTLPGYGNDEDSPYQPSLKPFEEPPEPDQSEKMTKLEEGFYDILEALMFFISDGQILLALAFSLYFIVSDRCTVSQYHIKIGLNLWLTAATITVFSLTVVRNCFDRLGSGLFRFALLAFSLIFSLGLPLALQVSSGFASEITPSDGRNSSQIFLNALCFMDSSFRKVVVDDQINNHAVIGACITNPELSQEFISWVAICVIWAVAILGRFGLRARGFIRERNNFADPDSGRRVESAYWCFLLLIWFFAVGTFSYRTWLIFDLRRWVANSPWIQDPNSETYIQGFGQWAAIISMAAIFLVVLDHNVSREDEE